MRISDWSSDVCSSDLLTVGEWAGTATTDRHLASRACLAYTPALPRHGHPWRRGAGRRTHTFRRYSMSDQLTLAAETRDRRSEERRVGKGCGSTCRSRWTVDHEKKKKKQT